jgi:type I restriction enzyme S subunit
MKPELLREAPVNTQGNLNVERIGAMGVPCPPLQEQRQIVRYVEKHIGTFDAAISRTEREIALIREYRTRLIADVVTGKLDVRHLVTKTITPSPEDLEPLNNGDVTDDELQQDEDLEAVEEVVDAD